MKNHALKLLFIAVLFACTGKHAQAQFLDYGKADAAAFVSLPLLVIVNDHLTDEFKAIIEKEWKVGNPSMKFVTPEEAEKMAESSPGAYSFLAVRKGTISNRFGDKVYKTEANKVVGYYHKKGNSYPYVLQVPYMHEPLTALDIRIAVRQFNVYMKALVNETDPTDVEKDIQTLLGKTLLIPQEVVEPPLTAKELGVDYTGKIEIKPWDRIEEIINEGGEGYAFVYTMIQANLISPAWIVVDASTYDILALVDFGGVYVGVGGVLWKTGKKEYLKPKDVKLFAGPGAQKVNRRKIRAT